MYTWLGLAAVCAAGAIGLLFVGLTRATDFPPQPFAWQLMAAYLAVGMAAIGCVLGLAIAMRRYHQRCLITGYVDRPATQSPS